MDIVLSQMSDKPIYTQIYEQIASQIMSGEISAGEKLPPIRTVALDQCDSCKAGLGAAGAGGIYFNCRGSGNFCE